MVGGIGYGMNDVYGYYFMAGRGISGTGSSPEKVNGSAGDISSAELRRLKQSGSVECETCKSRQYKDGSDESDVSFKAPGHINPGASAATVMAHEQEHVANAYEKAEKGNGRVVSASVKLQTAVCPECGRSYVSGGVTNTVIKYNESNPYGRAAKIQDAASLIGNKIDYAV